MLSQLLADEAAQTSPDLLRRYVTEPMGLRDTVVSSSEEQRRRFLQGYSPPGQPVHAWNMDAMAGAGGIRSTAGDMLTYLERNLHPAGLSGMRASHELLADVEPGSRRIALAWLYDVADGTYWHSGATHGYSSSVFFRPQDDTAGIVLTNTGPWPPLADSLALHIRQRLRGKPAISLGFLRLPGGSGFLALLRLYSAYVVTMLAAGAFIFCCVLGIQGVAAELLPRWLFLRASSFLQLGAFSLFLCGYFLQPGATPDALMSAQSGGSAAWLPSLWFVGLFQQLNGSPAFSALAGRAWIGLAVAVCGTAVAYILAYVRTLKKIVEEPDIVPGSARARWMPRFGNPLETAVVQFSLRCLLRSRQHRVILAFYGGIGFALVILFLKTPEVQQQFGSVAAASDRWSTASVPMLASSILVLSFWMLGTRVVCSLPLDLRANWIFRVTPVPGGLRGLAARRLALLVLGVAPPWIAFAAVVTVLWPWQQALGHAAVLGLLGIIAAEIGLHGAQKLPFTCSYLPGKSNFHLTFWLCVGLIVQIIDGGAQLELRALRFALMIAVLAAAALAARWWTSAAAQSEDTNLRFEEVPVPAIFALEVHKDGVVPL